MLGLVLPVLIAAASAWAEEARVTAWRANIRAGPGRSSPILVTLDRGAPLEVLGREGSWYKVRIPSSGLEGFVHASMIEPPAATAAAPPSPARPAATREVQVSGWKAHVRSGPSRAAGIVATLDRGAVLETLGRSGSWYRVRIPSSGETGFVHVSMVVRVPAPGPPPSEPPRPSPEPVRPPMPEPRPTPEPVPTPAPVQPQPPPPPPPPEFLPPAPVEPSVEAVAEDERFRVRGFMEGGVIVFNARESFQALFGGSSGGAFGGGLELQYRRFFLRAGVERVAKTGERVFVFEGEVFPLAIEDKVTITPLSAVVGYRFARLGPATLFAGAGVGSYKLTETAVLGDVSESVEERFTGFQGLVGAEFRINRWIGVAADVQYATVPRSLGTGGVSEVFAEEDLGGLGFRLHVLVGP